MKQRRLHKRPKKKTKVAVRKAATVFVSVMSLVTAPVRADVTAGEPIKLINRDNDQCLEWVVGALPTTLTCRDAFSAAQTWVYDSATGQLRIWPEAIGADDESLTCVGATPKTTLPLLPPVDGAVVTGLCDGPLAVVNSQWEYNPTTGAFRNVDTNQCIQVTALLDAIVMRDCDGGDDQAGIHSSLQCLKRARVARKLVPGVLKRVPGEKLLPTKRSLGTSSSMPTPTVYKTRVKMVRPV